jgi:hypothetical protein
VVVDDLYFGEYDIVVLACVVKIKISFGGF